MSLGSVKAQNISLDACYGSNHSSEWPSTIYLHLFVSDPTQGGVELTSAGGYAPVSVTNNSTNFPAASGGQKKNGTLISFGSSSGAWSGPADYWWFTDAAAGVAPPGAPTISQSGTTGATPYYYKVTSVTASGESTGSGTGPTFAGNAILSGSNYNIVAWSAVSGAATYNVYRSVDNVTFLLVGNTASTSFHDTGAAAGPATPPVSNTTMTLLDGGQLQQPVIVPASGYTVGFPANSIVLMT